jgi:UDP-galactopyranose mutase
MSRAARTRRVFFVEEPLPAPEIHVEVREVMPNLHVVVPHLPDTMTYLDTAAVMRIVFEELFVNFNVEDYILWFYSPMFLPWTTQLTPSTIVYDCMDELSLFDQAPTAISEYEMALLAKADVVFTGGISLYESKSRLHPNVHAFPSSINKEHFNRARQPQPDPADQAAIPHPRLGFAGVIDERMDLQLLAALADSRPDWHVVMLGPVVKIDPAALPRRANIHYLGMKSYNDLPAYMANWDAGLLPFALNNATRFISPTKTPEYLAAGLPVISTPIRDVVRTYGPAEVVHFWEDPTDPAPPVERALASDAAWRGRVDELLAPMSWDTTWRNMDAEITAVLYQNE